MKSRNDDDDLDQKTPILELLKGIPGLFGLQVSETPEYEVLQKMDSFEIRHYPPLALAQVTHSVTDSETFAAAQEKAFYKLANYMFGANIPQQRNSVKAVMKSISSSANSNADTELSVRISMTTPLLYEQADEGWKMSFILPNEYHMTNTPRPLDPSVKIEFVHERLMAVMPYAGDNTEKKMLHAKKVMANWLSKQRVHPIARPIFAQYDQPSTISFLKKNEVMVEVKVYH